SGQGFEEFFRIFPVPDGASGQSCGAHDAPGGRLDDLLNVLVR
ncbi:uncharacterized protein METZ01_LOCUS199207, partial [marine metagenome]